LSKESVWERLAPLAKKESETSLSEGRKAFWRIVRRLDVVAAACWSYAITKAVVDWDRAVLRWMDPNLEWIANFRILLFLILLLVMFKLGGKWAIVWVLYLVFWPLLLIVWRLPWAFYRREQWNQLIGLVHVVFGFVSSLKSTIFACFMGTAALFLLLLPGRVTALLAIVCALVFEGWLIWAAGRAAARPSRFLEKFRVPGKDGFNGLTSEAETSRQAALAKDGQLTVAETEAFLDAASQALVVNRIFYFLAYRISEYRKSPAVLLYAAFAVLGLFMVTVANLTLVNMAIYQVDSSAFVTKGGPASTIRFVYYSMTSLYGGEIEVIGARSDVAILIKALSLVIGVLVLGVLCFSLFMTIRYARDQEEAQETVRQMKVTAQKSETAFNKDFEISPAEALARLRELSHGAVVLFAYLARQVPDDFIDPGP
jgi:hypothetical protein